MKRIVLNTHPNPHSHRIWLALPPALTIFWVPLLSEPLPSSDEITGEIYLPPQAAGWKSPTESPPELRLWGSIPTFSEALATSRTLEGVASLPLGSTSSWPVDSTLVVGLYSPSPPFSGKDFTPLPLIGAPRPRFSSPPHPVQSLPPPSQRLQTGPTLHTCPWWVGCLLPSEFGRILSVTSGSTRINSDPLSDLSSSLCIHNSHESSPSPRLNAIVCSFLSEPPLSPICSKRELSPLMF